MNVALEKPEATGRGRDTRFALATLSLWFALGVHKVGVLAFSFKLGHLAGESGVGVMISSLSFAWLAGSLAGVGLPDRAVFLAAREVGRDQEPEASTRGVHLLFLLLMLLCFTLMIALGPFIGGDPSLGLFARLLLVGAAAQAWASFTLGIRRGQGRPGMEAACNALATVALLAGGLLARDMAELSAAWVASGLAFLIVSGVVWARDPSMRPLVRLDAFKVGRRSLHTLQSLLGASVPYLGLGLGSWLLGNIDLLLGRAFLDSIEMGRLQVGTTVVRSISLVPWILSGLLLHRFERRWVRGLRGFEFWVLAANLGISVMVGIAAWLVLPLLAQGYNVEAESVRSTTLTSVLCAPLLYAALAFLPITGARSIRRTVTLLALSLGLSLLVGLVAIPLLRMPGAVLAAGAGQLSYLLLSRMALREPESPSGEPLGG